MNPTQACRPGQSARSKLWKRIRACSVLYVFLLPSFALLAVFHYAPMYGIQIAFKNFKALFGIWGSAWVGLKHFQTFFHSYRFGVLLQNTLTVSVYSLVVGFPMPILLALAFNYVKSGKFKKLAQTVSYAPHFISTVVMVGMLSMFFSPTTGFINTFRAALGMDKIHFFGVAAYFPHLYVWSGVWQGAGWGAIIYIATLSGVDPEQHEAAIIDGAIIPQRMWHIDLPALLPTIVILLILNVGSLMSVGYEKVYLMQNPINLTTSEVISTYTYKIGLENAEYSYSAAIGLFNTVINFILLLSVNAVANKISGMGLF
ncbi:MAG TPA: ABC transporter permease subunit [Clostridia bacterium]|nr:ABC transporter permease subunit [Clostridia bacterium]